MVLDEWYEGLDFQTCLTCGASFEVTNPTQDKLHCPECKSRAKVYKKRDPRMAVCPICARAFKTRAKVHLYCSPECVTEAKRRHNRAHSRVLEVDPAGVCAVCGAGFVRKTSNQRYCSPECTRERARRQYYSLHGSKPAIGEGVCIECGSPFSKKTHGHRFCSLECNKANRLKRIQISSKQWTVLTEYMKEKSGYQCVYCGRHDTKLVIHHKTPLALGGDNSYENLECICESCHGKKHKEINRQFLLEKGEV